MVREGLTKRMPSEKRLEEGANHPAVQEGCCRQSKSLGLVDGVAGGGAGAGCCVVVEACLEQGRVKGPGLDRGV